MILRRRSFCPVLILSAREVARIALEKLIVDGRIHPARIEEMVEKAQKEVETMIREEGEAATLEVGVHGIHPELVRLLGKMKFRTSYGQNALNTLLKLLSCQDCWQRKSVWMCVWLSVQGCSHDIGKSVDHEMEGSPYTDRWWTFAANIRNHLLSLMPWRLTTEMLSRPL